MGSFKSFLRAIPWWAYVLVALVVTVNSVYLFYRFRWPSTDDDCEIRDYGLLITSVVPGGAADRAGIRPGDTIKAIDSVFPDEEYLNVIHHLSGDTATYMVLRNGVEVAIPVVFDRFYKWWIWYLTGMYAVIMALCIGSFYILYKKPADVSARLFFIFILLYCLSSNAGSLLIQHPVPNIAYLAFSFGGITSVAVLVHFHLLFPKPVPNYPWRRWFLWVIYLAGFTISIVHFLMYLLAVYIPKIENQGPFYLTDRIQVTWMTIVYCIAFSVAVYQFRINKNTLVRNQLRMVIIGSFFGLITPMAFALLYDWDLIAVLFSRFPLLLVFSHSIGSMIMILFLLVAIFRYRIWGTEIIIRKTLLYLVATAVITLAYLLLVYLADLITPAETRMTRFFSLALSAILFLIFRDRIQKLIDQFFHRESYDSATVVNDFEMKLAGIYNSNELNSKVVQHMDEIFNFKSFLFSLKKDQLIYEQVSGIGYDEKQLKEFYINPEVERKLGEAKIFSPDELSHKPEIFENTKAEIIVPLVSGNLLQGFFICGRKKSERTYSLQDIRVLSLLARRVVALYHTAHLYQKDLDRQLMLERERARISQDMHDDIGAGLTKIAMISEAPLQNDDQAEEVSNKMSKIASSSREMISRLNVIVWALNPKYDNLENLLSYMRRFFGEYLENCGIKFITDIPEEIPRRNISPDARRNIFYAIQEAVHNAVKHGKCNSIELNIRISDLTTEITLHDDGKGFDLNKPGSGGNGLVNMKRRAEELGGSLHIDSTPGYGTTVVFNFKMQQKGD